MKKILQLFILIFFTTIGVDAYAGGCAPSSANGTCPARVTLTPGAACVTGTTCNGGAQMTSSCLFAGSQCSWYSFTATATAMFVNIAVTANSGCHISSNVYRSTGSCVGTEVSCQAGAPLDDMHSLTGLTVGSLYYVQVCYSPGGPCGNGGSAQYCISVGEPDPPCNLCSTPCGTATGYATNPTTATVVADCQTSPFIPELAASSTNTFCYDFRATATSVNFNVIITSTCGNTGNVTNFSWELYNSPSCGTPVMTGTLASLTFSPVIIGNDYVFCYTFDVPSTCTHSQHCPFFVGATVLLSIDLVNFEAISFEDYVKLNWETARLPTETDEFVVERSSNAIDFDEIGPITADPQEVNYSFKDERPLPNVSYYRLKTIKTDGEISYSDVVSVTRDNFIPKAGLYIHNIFPQPANGSLTLDFESGISENIEITLINNLGQSILTKQFPVRSQTYQSLNVDVSSLSPGIYTLLLIDAETKLSKLRRISIR
jgi:hypothetical protein